MSFGSRSINPPTAAELRRQAACRAGGCIVCRQLGLIGTEACGKPEYNHRLSGGQRVGERYGYVLGRWHHQGFPKPGRSLDQMREKYGPNLRDDKSAFHARFGSDQVLQNYQDDHIGWPREEMPSKRELRERNPDKQLKRHSSRCTASSKTVPRPGA